MLILEIIGFVTSGDLTLPGWFLFVAGGFVAWMIWATRALFQNKANIAINENINIQFRVSILEKVNEIKGDMKEMRADFKEYTKEFKGLKDQIVEFFIEEIKILKNKRE